MAEMWPELMGNRQTACAVRFMEGTECKSVSLCLHVYRHATAQPCVDAGWPVSADACWNRAAVSLTFPLRFLRAFLRVRRARDFSYFPPFTQVAATAGNTYSRSPNQVQNANQSTRWGDQLGRPDGEFGTLRMMFVTARSHALHRR